VLAGKPHTILKKDLPVFEINQKRMAAATRLIIVCEG
jgi:hypothetical protein